MPRPASRCKNCKRLKIACDKKRPRCEYCIATNRECVYDLLSLGSYKSKSTSPQSTSTTDNFVTSDSDVGTDQILSPDLHDIELFLCSQLQLNSAYRQLGVSRFEYRLLHAFNHFFEKDFNKDIVKEYHMPYINVWSTEFPTLWQQRLSVRQGINSFVLMAFKELVNLNELLIEDVFHDETQEIHSIPLFEHSAAEMPSFVGSLTEGSGFQERLYEALLKNMKMITHQDLDTRALEYFGKCVQETTRLIETVIADETKLNAFTALEMHIASSVLYTFLILQPYRIMPLISFSDVQSDLLTHLVLLRSAFERAFPQIVNSRYRGILTFNEKMLPEPKITESYAITEELYRQFQEYQEHENEGEYVTDKILSGIRCLEFSIYRAIEFSMADVLIRWLKNLEIELYDLMHKQHYFSLKLLYYYSALLMIYELNHHKRSNMFLDYLRWFKLVNHGNHHWKQYDQDLYEVVQNELILTDIKQLKTFNPADHLFREYSLI